ncbi:hypothetical protein IAG25_41085, partial [Caballeronia sp. EK]|uniref:hypothetical protein n=1 Tax=Caballeronia sp. EK TaxID=2767469 RepID=UPI0016551C99
GYGLKDLPGGGEQLVSSLVATAINEARHLDPEELDWEIQAAVTRLNSQASKTVQSESPSSQEISLQTKVPPGYWKEPLLVLIRSIDKLPENQRLTRFDRVLAAAEQLNPADKARLLSALVGKIGWLPFESMQEAFERTLSTVEQLSISHQGKPLVALVEKIDRLPSASLEAIFHRILAHIKQSNAPDRSIALGRLATKIGWLPQEKHFASYQEIFDAVEQLDDCDRGKPLSEIARKVERVRGSLRFFDFGRDTFDRFLGMVKQLSLNDRQQIGKVQADELRKNMDPSQLPSALEDLELRLGVSLTDNEREPSEARSLQ